MRAFYERIPTAAELANTGFLPSDYETDDFELWPENMPAITLFGTLSTQWRSLGIGPSGLDYTVFFARMDRMNLSAQDYDWLFDDIRVIEAEALIAAHKKD